MSSRLHFAGSLAVIGFIAWHALGCSGETLTAADEADETKPTISLVSPADNSVVGEAGISLSGTEQDETRLSQVYYLLNGATTRNYLFREGSSPQTSAQFDESVTLTPGDNTVSVVATDAKGNEQVHLRHVRYDDAEPVVTITSPAAGSSSIADAVTLQGSVSDDHRVSRVTYRLNGGAETEVSITAGTNVSVNVPVAGLAVGNNTITLTGYDAANNSGSAQVTVARTEPTPAQTISVSAGAPVSLKRLADDGSLMLSGMLLVGDHEENGDKTFQGFVTYAYGEAVRAATTVESAMITIGLDPDEFASWGNPFTHNGKVCIQRSSGVVLNDDAQPVLTAEQCTVTALTAAGTATVDVAAIVNAARAAGETSVTLRFRFEKSVGGNSATDYQGLTVSPMTLTYR